MGFVGKILWAANTYWNSTFQVGANHLAQQLAEQGWNIAFISDPISPAHFLKRGFRQGVYDRFNTWKRGGEYALDNKVYFYTPMSICTPQNLPIMKTKWVLDNWQHYTLPNVVKKIWKHGFGTVDILIVDTVAQGFWFNYIDAKHKVYRVTDNFSGFPKATPHMLNREKFLAQEADIVIYTAQTLEKYVNNLLPRASAFVPNGVNTQHFKAGSREMPMEYRYIKPPIVVYVGAMDTWFDFDLMNYALHKLPEVSFVLIGPPEVPLMKLEHAKNLYILGTKKYDELSRYLYNADVGIIPFDVNKNPILVNNVNPIKLYEYMACGLPVVASKWDELCAVHSPALLYETCEGFVSNICKAIKASSIDRQLRVSFAEQADWHNRMKLLLQNILNT